MKAQAKPKTKAAMMASVRKFLPVAVVPDFELEYKVELALKINKLKKKLGAVIFGHNYMDPVLFHTVCDYVGDSLELSKLATTITEKILVFCGVSFMGETAKILSPEKKVLVPVKHAGCSLAEGITAEDVRWLKKQFPGLPIVAYVNTTAEVKAEVDVCCTSGNYTQVVAWACKDFGTKSVIFVPDKYMTQNIGNAMGREVFFPTRQEDASVLEEIPDYQDEEIIIGWQYARCYVHEQYTLAHIDDIRATYPDAIIIAHPECTPAIIAASNFSGSTSNMLKFIADQPINTQIALLTECAMADNIVATYPERMDYIIRMCNLRCKFMHMITLEDTLAALQNMQYEVVIPEEIRSKALISVQRMISITGGTK